MNIYKAFEDEINQHYRVTDVTEEGINYILEQLRYGRTLSNLVEQYNPIESGKVETFAHRSVEKSALSQFQTTQISRDLPESIRNFPKDGSKWGIDPAESFFVIPTVQDFLAKNKQHICVIEDIDSSPTGWLTPPVWIPKTPPFFTYNDKDVYFYIDEEDLTAANIRESFSIGATSWSVRAFLTSIPANMKPLTKNQKIDIDILKNIAKQTEKIIVSAYDGEGYLIWNRSKAAD